MNVDIKKLVAEGPQDLISDTERKERLDSVLFAQANLELEGEIISPLLIKESVRFINGEITLEKLQKFSICENVRRPENER